ncbi:MAG: hypothetical protein ACO3FI_03370 [Cyclobacteriaceae bacterium]
MLKNLFHSILLSLAGLLLITSCKKETYDLIIRGANVIDGTGSAGKVTDIGVRGDTISTIGDLSGAQAREVVDAKGLFLSPGFIDTHSHHRGHQRISGNHRLDEIIQ